jgi:hypothetical protein
MNLKLRLTHERRSPLRCLNPHRCRHWLSDGPRCTPSGHSLPCLPRCRSRLSVSPGPSHRWRSAMDPRHLGQADPGWHSHVPGKASCWRRDLPCCGMTLESDLHGGITLHDCHQVVNRRVRFRCQVRGCRVEVQMVEDDTLGQVSVGPLEHKVGQLTTPSPRARCCRMICVPTCES